MTVSMRHNQPFSVGWSVSGNRTVNEKSRRQFGAPATTLAESAQSIIH